MALRDQPYLPLYVQDFMTDEKLIECSPLATGVYIRLMCIMHKADEYGKILLEQKYKQTDKQDENFACKIAKQMPYDFADVLDGIRELLAERVIFIEGDYLVQRRMVKDNTLSLVRAKAGKKGGIFAQAKVKANIKANTENENEIENEVVTDKKREKGKKPKIASESNQDAIEVIAYLNTRSGKNFNATRPQSTKFVNSRLVEGYSVEDLKKIIDCKVKKWGEDDKMRQYIRPETLFAPSKIDAYLQDANDQQIIKPSQNGRIRDKF